MKKRDLTKLALMGIAIGLCGGQIQADEDMGDVGFDEQTLVAACSSCQAKPNVPSNQPVNQTQQAPAQQYQSNAQAQQQRPMGQGKQMTKQGGYLVSEAPEMPGDHPANTSANGQQGQQPQKPQPQKVNPSGSNNNNQGRPTADANNNYSNSGCGNAAPAPRNINNPQQRPANQQYPTNR